MQSVSWKTTVTGIIAALGAILTAVGTDNSTIKIIGLVLTIIGTAGMGLAARDHGVSSAAAGITPSVDPTNPLGLDPATAATVKSEVEALVAAIVAAKTVKPKV